MDIAVVPLHHIWHPLLPAIYHLTLTRQGEEGEAGKAERVYSCILLIVEAGDEGDLFKCKLAGLACGKDFW